MPKEMKKLENAMIKNNILKMLGGRIGVFYLVDIVFFILIIISHYILRYTKLGLYAYAVGSNAQAAKLTGINLAKIKVFAYTYTGFLCGIAGIMTVARMMTATTEIGIGMEFSVISAVVIGGCSLQGGRGDMTGTFIGTLLMAVINSGIVQIGISTYYQPIIKGVVILAAVLFDIAYTKYVFENRKNAGGGKSIMRRNFYG